MNEDELLAAIRSRIEDPRGRIDETTVPTPPLYGVAPSGAVELAESALALRFPPLLERLYCEVGNGGFGPGAGLIGLDGGYADSDGRTLRELYASLRSEWWPDNLIPLCDWSAGAWAAVDPTGRVVTVDESGETPTKFALDSWFAVWLSGAEMIQETFELIDVVMKHPRTKQPWTVKQRGRAKSS